MNDAHEREHYRKFAIDLRDMYAAVGRKVPETVAKSVLEKSGIDVNRRDLLRR